MSVSNWNYFNKTNLMNIETDIRTIHSRRLRAIVFADVVGYSRMMAEEEVDTSTRIASLISDLEKLCLPHNAELVQSRGDG